MAMNFTKYINGRFIKFPVLFLLTVIFSFGFNFLRILFPDHQGTHINAIESGRFNSCKILTDQDYRIFPSRKQLIAEPEDIQHKTPASCADPSPAPSLLFFCENTFNHVHTRVYGRIYNWNLPIGPPSAVLSRYCVFLI